MEISKINEKRLIETFIDLVKISSPSWEEHKVIDHIIKTLSPLKVSIKKIKCQNSYNLLVKIPGSEKNKKTTLFAAHTDTVTPCKNIKVVQTEKKIMSDGNTILGGDDKAAVAVFIETIRHLKQHNIQHGPLEFLFTCAEEVGLQGMKLMDFSKLNAKQGFVFDSSGPIGLAAVKAPYHMRVHVDITGKAAHAGMEPEKGISAIHVLSEIIFRIPKGRIDKETTCNVGTISGGEATNIVAEHASMVLEFRSLRRNKLLALKKQLHDQMKQVCKKHKAKINIKNVLEYEGFEIKKEDTLLKIFEEACTKAHLLPLYEASGGGSDTNVLNKKGIKSLNLSVGMQKVHTTSEFILKSDLIKVQKLLLAIIDSL